MKVITPKEMQTIESSAILAGSSEIDFMEEAGSGIALIVQDLAERRGLDRQVFLLAGKGNNAGDAYVAGVHLLHLDFDVTAIQAYPIEQSSSLCQDNTYRFQAEGGKIIAYEPGKELLIPRTAIIVDGLFGTGFKGKVGEPASSLIELANQSEAPIIAIDIPSGLNGETGQCTGPCIIAEETAFLGLPKQGFFLNQGWNSVGKLRFIDFGLPKPYLDQAHANLLMLTADEMHPLLPRIVRNRHKYQAGHVVGWAGSPQFPGAGSLAGYAALRGGAGIVHLLFPEEEGRFLQNGPFELITVPFQNNGELIEWLNKASAVFLGPGLGMKSKNRLLEILPHISRPCVLDADALTILAEENVVPPKHAVLTPHLGELMRLLGLQSLPTIDQNFLSKVQSFVESREITLVLKGGPTFIFHPGTPVYVNPTGNPGMATAGSGDVLTGLIASLLAQKASPLQAAMLGVFIHGIAGDFAAFEYTPYCITATDILNYFPEGFRLMEL